MARGYDEPFTLYGLIARRVATDDARTFVTFELDPAARFSDGKPITPEDVLFSWQLLRDKGRPNHRIYYSKVIKAEAIGSNAVRFDLAGRRPRAAADPRPDAGAAEARDRSGDLRGDHAQADDRQRTLCHRQGRSRPQPDARCAIRTIGDATSRSIAASGISTRSATTSIAIRTPCTKPSSAACSTCARRPIRRAGSRATTSRRCATDRSSRRR